jgi:hypothetical protein
MGVGLGVGLGIGSVGAADAVDVGAKVVGGADTAVRFGTDVDGGPHALRPRKSSPIERSSCHRIIVKPLSQPGRITYKNPR